MLHLFKDIKKDLPASIVVFFVALPLCLGIALASGAPLFSGIIAGVVGGIVVGALSGSPLGVSGPAAGLAVIVLTAITTLGSWDTFLLAVVIAGVLQVAMGYAKMGVITYYFPVSVIKGMLTGIGLIIILKQIPHALGYTGGAEGLFSGGIAAISTLFTPAALIVAFVSMFILIFWENVLMKKSKLFMIIQGPLVVVFAGIGLSYIFINFFPALAFRPDQLVTIPVSTDFESFKALFTFPDFSQIGNYNVWIVAVTIAVIASIETLLSVEATDKLDPYKRKTPTNRELKAQGVGNVLSGLIGGLPITQVIVRSSANISFGGKTKMSAIIHGFFLMISAISIPVLLNMIPLAALACVLIVVGYKLAKPVVFKSMYKLGSAQFVPFAATVAGILATDLLKGIGIGMAFAIFYILRNNYRNAFQEIQQPNGNGEPYKIVLSEEVSFLNKSKVLNMLNQVPANSKVEIDGTKTQNLDYDVAEVIMDFKKNAKEKNIEVEFNYVDNIN
ncbi:MAG: SulP family inorganic anion transporter [Cyclobacteriaceae bacterium]|nr:SulP family inorganic anion transporter [Cyclobacteriaceae bacterium]